MTTQELLQRFENEQNYLEADLVAVQNEKSTMDDRIEQMKKIVEEYNRQKDNLAKPSPKTPSVVEREKNAGKKQKENRTGVRLYFYLLNLSLYLISPTTDGVNLRTKIKSRP